MELVTFSTSEPGRRSAGAAALDLSDDAIYALDLEGLIVSWNPGAARIFGYAAEEVLGAPSSLLAPAERATEEAGLLSLARAGEATRGLETSRRRKDGRRVDVALSLAPLRDERGAVNGAVALARDLSELHALNRALMESSERERRRFGQDLHEGIGQDLTGLALACRALELRLAPRSRECAAELKRISVLLNKTIARTRALARGLYPVGLDGEALPEFLRELTRMVEETFWIRCEIEWDSDARVLGEAQARGLYWIVQEAVMNAVRHGDPKLIRVRGWRESLGVRVSVRDDGKALGPEPPVDGTGLLVMRSRARAMGASLVLGNHPDGGVLVECRLPPSE